MGAAPVYPIGGLRRAPGRVHGGPDKLDLIRFPGKWNVTKRRSNLELYQSCQESGIINLIKLQRIKWVGYVARMDENRTTNSLQCPTYWHTKKGQAKS
ncbi:hypothetical protein TNCV_3153631 [Trichonephila clavipes]|nr:hypothetical protein TNCV_3153631 [Trichonephila clavipes]